MSTYFSSSPMIDSEFLAVLVIWLGCGKGLMRLHHAQGRSCNESGYYLINHWLDCIFMGLW